MITAISEQEPNENQQLNDTFKYYSYYYNDIIYLFKDFLAVSVTTDDIKDKVSQ